MRVLLHLCRDYDKILLAGAPFSSPWLVFFILVVSVYAFLFFCLLRGQTYTDIQNEQKKDETKHHNRSTSLPGATRGERVVREGDRVDFLCRPESHERLSVDGEEARTVEDVVEEEEKEEEDDGRGGDEATGREEEGGDVIAAEKEEEEAEEEEAEEKDDEEEEAQYDAGGDRAEATEAEENEDEECVATVAGGETRNGTGEI